MVFACTKYIPFAIQASSEGPLGHAAAERNSSEPTRGRVFSSSGLCAGAEQEGRAEAYQVCPEARAQPECRTGRRTGWL